MPNAELKVQDLMSRNVTTVQRNEQLVVAEEVMRLGRIRHLPVLDQDGTLVGLVSQRDLFHSGVVRALGFGVHAHERAISTLSIKKAMTTDLVTTAPDIPIRQAAELMIARKIGCLTVLENGKLVGILTESAFVART
jgi:CBS domain-containing membrane protein